MKETKEVFTIEEVERLVKNAYNVGFCDGVEDREYNNEDDFWDRNINNWLTKEITYGI